MPYEEGDVVVVKAAGEYEGVEATVVEEGEDAAGNATVYVELDDERSGASVIAGFAPEEIESGGEG